MRSVRGYASILVNGKIAILMRLLPHVADATDRAQMRCKIITELGAHTSHMHVDRTRTPEIIEAPDTRKQCITRIHVSRMRYQKRKQRVLKIGKVNGIAIDKNLIGREIDNHRIDCDEIGIGRLLPWPQKMSHANEQLIVGGV